MQTLIFSIGSRINDFQASRNSRTNWLSKLKWFTLRFVYRSSIGLFNAKVFPKYNSLNHTPFTMVVLYFLAFSYFERSSFDLLINNEVILDKWLEYFPLSCHIKVFTINFSFPMKPLVDTIWNKKKWSKLNYKISIYYKLLL